jgi:RHS repeat-associated protein
VLFLTDAAGVVANEYAYDAYGRPLVLLESVDNPYLFTGREYDPESGLYHYRARAYDPDTGRFLQQDPLGFAAGDLNLYRYVLNDPVNFTDPDGQVWQYALRWVAKKGARYAARGAIALCKYSRSCTKKLFDAVKKGKELVDRAARKIAQLCKRRGDDVATNVDPNKLNHIFGQEKHKLSNVVKQFGSEKKAFDAIQQATETAVKSQKLKGVFETTVKIGTEAVTVQGNVVDGAVKIGTAFVP